MCTGCRKSIIYINIKSQIKSGFNEVFNASTKQNDFKKYNFEVRTWFQNVKGQTQTQKIELKKKLHQYKNQNTNTSKTSTQKHTEFNGSNSFINNQ